MLVTGCATPYLTDRARDAGDAVTLTFGYGVGAMGRAGPVALGLFAGEERAGLRGGVLGWFTIDFYDDDIGY